MISYLCIVNMLIRQLVGDPSSSREEIDVNNNKSEPGSEASTPKILRQKRTCMHKMWRSSTQCFRIYPNKRHELLLGVSFFGRSVLAAIPRSFAVRLLSRSPQFICNISPMSRPLSSSICRASLNEYERRCITK